MSFSKSASSLQHGGGRIPATVVYNAICAKDLDSNLFHYQHHFDSDHFGFPLKLLPFYLNSQCDLLSNVLPGKNVVRFLRLMFSVIVLWNQQKPLTFMPSSCHIRLHQIELSSAKALRKLVSLPGYPNVCNLAFVLLTPVPLMILLPKPSISKRSALQIFPIVPCPVSTMEIHSIDQIFRMRKDPNALRLVIPIVCDHGIPLDHLKGSKESFQLGAFVRRRRSSVQVDFVHPNASSHRYRRINDGYSSTKRRIFASISTFAMDICARRDDQVRLDRAI